MEQPILTLTSEMEWEESDYSRTYHNCKEVDYDLYAESLAYDLERYIDKYPQEEEKLKESVIANGFNYEDFKDYEQVRMDYVEKMGEDIYDILKGFEDYLYDIYYEDMLDMARED